MHLGQGCLTSECGGPAGGWGFWDAHHAGCRDCIGSPGPLLRAAFLGGKQREHPPLSPCQQSPLPPSHCCCVSTPSPLPKTPRWCWLCEQGALWASCQAVLHQRLWPPPPQQQKQWGQWWLSRSPCTLTPCRLDVAHRPPGRLL